MTAIGSYHRALPGNIRNTIYTRTVFLEVLFLVVYTGVGQSNVAFTMSPELTTNGMLPKAWRFIEGEGIYLYRSGTFGAAYAGNETLQRVLRQPDHSNNGIECCAL